MARITDNGRQMSAPVWVADFLEPNTHIARFPAKVDASQFQDAEAVKVTVNGTAAANATSVTVLALSAAIPSGTMLYFGVSKEFALLTAAAAAGATSLTVQALPTQLNTGDIAYYSPKGSRKLIKSGTFVGRTYAERDANTPFGPAAVTDDEVYLLLFDIEDASLNNDAEFYRHNGTVKENYLPDWTVLNTATNEVQTVTIAGTLSAGSITFVDPATGNRSDGVAFNGNLAAIQADLDALFGASQVVAAGTIASFTLTYSGANYAGKDVLPIIVDPDGLTGLTGITVVETTKGGYPLRDLIRSKYRCIKGVN